MALKNIIFPSRGTESPLAFPLGGWLQLYDVLLWLAGAWWVVRGVVNITAVAEGGWAIFHIGLGVALFWIAHGIRRGWIPALKAAKLFHLGAVGWSVILLAFGSTTGAASPLLSAVYNVGWLLYLVRSNRVKQTFFPSNPANSADEGVSDE
jgi:hypothetical protein